jgi:hypothetical protein
MLKQVDRESFQATRADGSGFCLARSGNEAKLVKMRNSN